jgi:catechol 2,3-dioxygenase-like lactoylglutathione lyase family enzyme
LGFEFAKGRSAEAGAAEGEIRSLREPRSNAEVDMFMPKSHIHLDAGDLARSAAFYEALLGAPPSRRSLAGAIFELDSPPLVLTLEQRTNARTKVRQLPRFSLVVNEPAQVGHAAIALRRAGIRLRLEDEGIQANDPDGNNWHVRFVPSATARTVVAAPPEGEPAEERRRR